MPKLVKLPDYAKDGTPHSEQKLVGRNNITILDKAGQDAMRKVCRLSREVLDAAAAAIRPGVTTDYLDEVVHKACIERDVSGFRSFRAPSFPRLCLVSLTSVAYDPTGLSFSFELLSLPQVELYERQ